jgi:hypothetical protein
MNARLSIKATTSIILITVLLSFFITIVYASSLVGISASLRAVDYSFQRKTFYAEGRYWVFYYEAVHVGLGLGYKSSTDGVNFEPGNPIYISDATYDFCLDFNGSHLVWAFPCGQYVYFQMSKPLSNGTITPVADRQTVFNSGDANDIISKVFIIFDSNNNIFVSYSWYDVSAGVTYNRVHKTSSKNGSWVEASGFPVSLVTGDYTVTLQKMGNDVNCIYTSNNAVVKAKRYYSNNNTFSSEQILSSSKIVDSKALSSVENNIVFLSTSYSGGTSQTRYFTSNRNTPTSYPNAYTVLTGSLSSGSLSNLQSSDNVYMVFNKNTANNIIEIVFTGTISLSNWQPFLQVDIEAHLSNSKTPPYVLEVAAYNYLTESYETTGSMYAAVGIGTTEIHAYLYCTDVFLGKYVNASSGEWKVKVKVTGDASLTNPALYIDYLGQKMISYQFSTAQSASASAGYQFIDDLYVGVRFWWVDSNFIEHEITPYPVAVVLGPSGVTTSKSASYQLPIIENVRRIVVRIYRSNEILTTGDLTGGAMPLVWSTEDLNTTVGGALTVYYYFWYSSTTDETYFRFGSSTYNSRIAGFTVGYTTVNMIKHLRYNAGWSESTVVSGVSSTSYPVLSVDANTNNLYCFYATANHIYYAKYDGTWQTPVDWINEGERLTSNNKLTCFYQSGGNAIGLVYLTGSMPYNVKFEYLPLITKTWHDIALWSQYTLTRKWLNIASFSENLLTRKWTDIASTIVNALTRKWQDISSYILSLLTRSWNSIATFAVSVFSRMWNAIAFWTFDLLTTLIMRLWHDIVYWSTIIGDTIFANSYFKYLAVSGLAFVILFILIFEEGKKK